MLRLLLNLSGYYLVWFACVLSASRGYVWVGFIASIIVTMLQVYCQSRFYSGRYLLHLIVALTLVGFAIDSFLLNWHLLYFQANPFNPRASAPWMIGLWINFAFILYAHIRSLFLRPWLLSVLALFGFPLAYYGGVVLGAANLPQGYIGLMVLGVFWAVAFPATLRFFGFLIDDH